MHHGRCSHDAERLGAVVTAAVPDGDDADGLRITDSVDDPVDSDPVGALAREAPAKLVPDGRVAFEFAERIDHRVGASAVERCQHLASGAGEERVATTSGHRHFGPGQRLLCSGQGTRRSAGSGRSGGWGYAVRTMCSSDGRSARRVVIFSLLPLLAMLASCGLQDAILRVDPGVTVEEGSVIVRTEDAGEVLRVGFDRRLDLETDVRQVGSLLRWTQEHSDLRFRLESAPDFEITAESLCNGEIDVALAGTLSYLQAREWCGATMLVRGINEQGSSSYRAAIITAPGSMIRELHALSGRRFAFGHVTSTQGHLIPLEMLREVGVGTDDLELSLHAGSHMEAAEMVLTGVVDAAAIQDTLAMDLAERGLVDIMATSAPYPTSGIVVGSSVPRAVREELGATLRNLLPSAETAQLHEWDRSEAPGGFAAADDAQYEELRDVARLAGLLDQP